MQDQDRGSHHLQGPTFSSNSTSTRCSARIISLSSKSSQYSNRQTTVESRPTLRGKSPALGVVKLGTIPGSAPTRSPTHRVPMHPTPVKVHQEGTRPPATNSSMAGAGSITSLQKKHRKTRTAFWVRSSSTQLQQQCCLIVVLHILLLLKGLRRNAV